MVIWVEKMLHVILLDSALELIPSEITSQKIIQRHASRRGKKPTELLLDQNHHGQSMLKLENHERRGRPDIAYLCLMTLLESPLCKGGLLRVYIHLQDGRIIETNPSVRLPRNYDRFVGLFEQILLHGKVPPKGDSLLWITDYTLSSLLEKIQGKDESISILATEGGKKTSLKQLSNIFPTDETQNVVIGVGAFPHGDLEESTKKSFETHIELDPEIMMAWHVCGEILWIYSLVSGVTESRVKSEVL